MIALLDNTVISNFSFVQRPDLVRAALDGVVATVQEVFAEHTKGVETARVPDCDWSWLPLFELTNDESTLCASLTSDLGIGEAACIACATYRALRLFTDDRERTEDSTANAHSYLRHPRSVGTTYRSGRPL